MSKKAMTLREAVETIDMPVAMLDDAINQYNRAKAIVDAAVEAHEARKRQHDAFQNRPDGSLEDVRRFMHEWYQAVKMAEDRLAALERGEEVK